MFNREAEKGKARRSSNSGSVSSGDQHPQEYCPGTVHAVAAAAAAAAAPYDPYAYYPHPGPVDTTTRTTRTRLSTRRRCTTPRRLSTRTRCSRHNTPTTQLRCTVACTVSRLRHLRRRRGAEGGVHRGLRGDGFCRMCAERQVFVGGLPRLSTESDMFRFFSSHGQIDDVKLVLDSRTGMSKRFGFITFADVATRRSSRRKRW